MIQNDTKKNKVLDKKWLKHGDMIKVAVAYGCSYTLVLKVANGERENGAIMELLEKKKEMNKVEASRKLENI